jgi:hypothetical protein
MATLGMLDYGILQIFPRRSAFELMLRGKFVVTAFMWLGLVTVGGRIRAHVERRLCG